jgi:hypothetical protein
MSFESENCKSNSNNGQEQTLKYRCRRFSDDHIAYEQINKIDKLLILLKCFNVIYSPKRSLKTFMLNVCNELKMSKHALKIYFSQRNIT